MSPTPRPLPFRIARFVGLLILAWLALSWLVVLILRFVPPWTSAMMMERRVEAFVTHEPDFSFRHRWVPWDAVSPQVGLAMVAGEDQKFPFHHGFDIDAIQDAIDASDEGKRLRGASTISQQVAKNLFLWNGRSFIRKGLEAYFTVLIEATWPKRRILEVYMNIVELGNGIYGVGAASDVFYHTTPDRLGAIQAARLAAVLPNPRRFRVDAPSAYVQKRTAWIAQQMEQLGGPAYLTRPAPVAGRTR
ncbi:MAG TPA: monofunctional biosynthetic peptidoglycan transglycosylase [Luteibacter sp.]|uniref:monofunctional biosynthetic peptidoglycan transglycosylase n=1 Tax=Luteibacter sp. TaxID=1886636 RepID=UPI002C22ECEE|nr:monofunctional biosynthetic peptidoglycan transglycosylase [Luteibacter sp.]HVI53999.1 monofunctional biosynthetic peptidoglycan transglycosylase [Luteibacter sp.]